MYIEYFGLTRKPFDITTDPSFLWLGEKHREALATLRYGIQDNRGFLLLTGEVGTGKTILVNELVSLLDPDTIVVTLPDPDLNCTDFYKLLAYSFKIEQPIQGKAEFLIHFREFLHQCHADHKQVLLILDESQRLNHQLMEEIRVLSNIELQDRKLINIFFIGQPEFNSILMQPENRALSQRITVRYNIEALNLQETSDYVTHRLRAAGSKKPIFKITALNEIFYFSRGIPRLINIVCDHALLTAFTREMKAVDANIIRECVEELRIPVEQAKPDASTFRTMKEAVLSDAAAPEQLPATAEPGKEKIPGILLKFWNVISVPEMPKQWRLYYCGGILLVFLSLVILIGHYVISPARQDLSPGLTPKEDKTTLKGQEGERFPVGATPTEVGIMPNGTLTKTKPHSPLNHGSLPAFGSPISKNSLRIKNSSE
jgi:type II secretory pathway predicted ATPase ExeA